MWLLLSFARPLRLFFCTHFASHVGWLLLKGAFLFPFRLLLYSKGWFWTHISPALFSTASPLQAFPSCSYGIFQCGCKHACMYFSTSADRAGRHPSGPSFPQWCCQFQSRNEFSHEHFNLHPSMLACSWPQPSEGRDMKIMSSKAKQRKELHTFLDRKPIPLSLASSPSYPIMVPWFHHHKPQVLRAVPITNERMTMKK